MLFLITTTILMVYTSTWLDVLIMTLTGPSQYVKQGHSSSRLRSRVYYSPLENSTKMRKILISRYLSRLCIKVLLTQSNQRT